MTTKDKLALMKEIDRRNDERWNISTKQQEAKQTAVEYSVRENLMILYIR